jgi:hypothetical protein
MKHEDKVKAIQFIRPDAEFALTGDELEWRDENQTQPTESEIEAGLVAYKKAQEAELKTKDQAREAAQAKLAALGLTVEDLQALGL